VAQPGGLTLGSALQVAPILSTLLRSMNWRPVRRVLVGFSVDSSCVSRRAFVDRAPPTAGRSSRAVDSARSTRAQSAAHTTAARTGPCGNSPAIHTTNQRIHLYLSTQMDVSRPTLCQCFLLLTFCQFSNGKVKVNGPYSTRERRRGAHLPV